MRPGGGGLLCSSWLAGLDKGGKVVYFRGAGGGRLAYGEGSPFHAAMGDGPSKGRLMVLLYDTFAMAIEVPYNCCIPWIFRKIPGEQEIFYGAFR